MKHETVQSIAFTPEFIAFYKADRRFNVTVTNGTNGDQQTILNVPASDEWSARTMAMFSLTMKLNGALATYEVASA